MDRGGLPTIESYWFWIVRSTEGTLNYLSDASVDLRSTHSPFRLVFFLFLLSHQLSLKQREGKNLSQIGLDNSKHLRNPNKESNSKNAPHLVQKPQLVSIQFIKMFRLTEFIDTHTKFPNSTYRSCQLKFNGGRGAPVKYLFFIIISVKPKKKKFQTSQWCCSLNALWCGVSYKMFNEQ